MKLLRYVLLFVICLSTSVAGFAQTVSLSVENARLEDVLKSIKRQTNFTYIGKADLISKAKRVTIHLKDVPIAQALEVCFKDQPFTYAVNGQIIMIKPFSMVNVGNGTNPSAVSPPLVPVNGVVINEKQEPVVSASIFVENTRLGTQTNEKGEFELPQVNSDAVLIISSVNIETQKVHIEGRTRIVIIARSRIVESPEVEIVSTGYQNINKAKTAGSYTQVDSGLYHRQVGANVLSRLEGVTAGLLFDNHTGVQHLQIRGLSTIKSNIEPLIILDNFPYTGDLNNINPYDIESVTVLKDAAAASIWGASAGNGVIVINTKKNKYNQALKINITSNLSYTVKPNLHYFKKISSSDFIDVEKFLFSKGYYDNDLSNTTDWPLVSPVVEILDQQRRGLMTQDQANLQINSLRKNDVRNDFEKYVYQSSLVSQNYLNASGGNAQASYILGFGYDNTGSIAKGNNTGSRYTVTSQVALKPANFLDLNVGLNYSQNTQRNPAISYPLAPGSGKSELYPYATLRDNNGKNLAIPYTYRLSFIDTVGNGKMQDWHYIPLDELYNRNSRNKTIYMAANIGAAIKFTRWLIGEIKYRYINERSTTNTYNDPGSFFTRNLINQFYNPAGANAAAKYPVPVGGIQDLSINESQVKNFRGQLDFSRSWKSIHDLNMMVAAEVSETKISINGLRYYGYDPRTSSIATSIDYSNYFPAFLTGLPAQIPNNNGITMLTNRTVSFLGNASYTFNKKYTLYASARKDGSNLFGARTNDKWKPLWSSGIGYDISREDFYNVAWAPVLKIRASYGYAGNTNNTVPAFSTITYLSAVSSLTGGYVAAMNNPPNPNLRWEEVRIVNVGIDFGLLKSRVSGSIEVFTKGSKDVLALFPIDPTLGIDGNTATMNAANLSSKGLDLSLNSKNIVGSINWSTALNLSYAKTIVTNYFQNQVFNIPSQTSINPNKGKVAWGLYSYKWGGLDPATGDPIGFYNKQSSKNYKSIINDSFQNHILNGSAIPLIFGNILNTANWKRISLSINIVYKFKYYFRRPSLSYSALFNNWSGNEEYARRWQKAGDEKVTNVPSIVYPADPNRDLFYNYANTNVEKGDNIRLKDIRLSYDLSKIRRSPFSAAQLYLYASNLNWVIWKATSTNYDPDYLTGSLPPLKNISLGFNMIF